MTASRNSDKSTALSLQRPSVLTIDHFEPFRDRLGSRLVNRAKGRVAHVIDPLLTIQPVPAMAAGIITNLYNELLNWGGGDWNHVSGFIVRESEVHVKRHAFNLGAPEELWYDRRSAQHRSNTLPPERWEPFDHLFQFVSETNRCTYNYQKEYGFKLTYDTRIPPNQLRDFRSKSTRDSHVPYKHFDPTPCMP